MLRGILRVCLALKRSNEAKQNPTFTDWFNKTVTANTDVPQIKDLYDQIVESSTLN